MLAPRHSLWPGGVLRLHPVEEALRLLLHLRLVHTAVAAILVAAAAAIVAVVTTIVAAAATSTTTTAVTTVLCG